MDTVYVLMLMTGALGTVFGWFVHRRLDDLRSVRYDIKELADDLCNVEKELARLEGRIGGKENGSL